MVALIVVRTIIRVDLGGNPINSIRGQLGSELGWFGPESRPNQDTEFLADNGIAWKIAHHVVWPVAMPAVITTNDGTAPVRRWYYPD